MELLERLERLDPVKSGAIERLKHLKLLEPLELLYPMLKATGYIRSVKQREMKIICSQIIAVNVGSFMASVTHNWPAPYSAGKNHL